MSSLSQSVRGRKTTRREQERTVEVRKWQSGRAGDCSFVFLLYTVVYLYCICSVFALYLYCIFEPRKWQTGGGEVIARTPIAVTSDCHRLELPSPPNCHCVHCCFVRVTILFLVFRFHPASPKTSLVVKSIPLPLERMGLKEASHLQVITPPNFRLPGSQAGSVCCSLKPKSPIITSFRQKTKLFPTPLLLQTLLWLFL